MDLDTDPQTTSMAYRSGFDRTLSILTRSKAKLIFNRKFQYSSKYWKLWRWRERLSNVDWHCCEQNLKNLDFSTCVKVGVGFSDLDRWKSDRDPEVGINTMPIHNHGQTFSERRLPAPWRIKPYNYQVRYNTGSKIQDAKQAVWHFDVDPDPELRIHASD